MSNNYLAFDFGAESGRAILGKLAGGKITLEEIHRFANPNGTINGQLCWNLQGQWDEIKKGLAKAASHGKIDSVGVDTWGVDFGLLSDSGELIGLPVCYRDARTDGLLDYAFGVMPREQIYKITGIQFMQLNTLYQLLAMKKAGSTALSTAGKLLFMPDLFNFLLTGKMTVEATIASTSQMLDAKAGMWSDALIDKFSLPKALFGPITPAGSIIGTLRPDVAKECGTEEWTVVAPGTHDTASAVAAVPAEPGSNYCYLSSGTWSLMGVELDQPDLSDLAAKFNFTNEVGVYGKIRFLKNIAGLWLVQECRRYFLAHGQDHSYAELTKMAANSRSFTSLIDVNQPEFLKPGEMPTKIRDYCKRTGQVEPENAGAMVRCCLDSLAMEYRRVLDQLEQLQGRKVDVIHIVGGGTQNLLLNELTADVCNRNVIAGPVEATALGNLMVQAIATGAVNDLAAARKIIRDSFELRHYMPRPDDRVATAYDRYLSLVGDSK
jgi:rhamnulokinase